MGVEYWKSVEICESGDDVILIGWCCLMPTAASHYPYNRLFYIDFYYNILSVRVQQMKNKKL